MAFFIERSRIYLWRDNENNLLADKEIAEKFKINLSNRNQVLQEVYEDDKILLKDKWQQTRKMWTETCEETVGRRKVKHKDWMSALTLLKIQARKEKKSTLNNCRTRTAKAEAQKEYTVAHQEERRSIHYKQADKPIKDKQGKTLTTTEEQLERWAEHFSELLNRPAPERPSRYTTGSSNVTYKMWQNT